MRWLIMALVMTVSLWPAGSAMAQDVLPRASRDSSGGNGPGGDGRDRPNRHGVTISPEIVITRRPAEVPASPKQIVAELDHCRATGVMDIGACLWDRHSSVSIRRLEACLQAETIPVDATLAEACLAAGHW